MVENISKEIELHRTDTNNNFNLMIEKYGSISRDLSETKKELTTAFQELPDRLVSAFLKGLKQNE